AAKLGAHVEPGPVGQLDVEQHDVRMERVRRLDPAAGRLRLADHLKSVRLEDCACRSAKARVIVDDQDGSWHWKKRGRRLHGRAVRLPTLLSLRSHPFPIDLRARKTEDSGVSVSQESISARVTADRARFVARGVATPRLVVDRAEGAR